jgi:hypothetical protein
VQQIDACLQQLEQVGGAEIAQALATITEAVIAEKSFSKASKNELLEQLAFLSTQVTTRPDERKPGLVRSVITGIREAAQSAEAIASAWARVEPLLKFLLGP